MTTDPSIGPRMADELYRIAGVEDVTMTELLDRMGIMSSSVVRWRAGLNMPNALTLRALCEAGGDVVYVLTGSRVCTELPPAG